MEVKKTIMAIIAAGSTYLFGVTDSFFIAFIVFVIIDFITGVLGAIFQKKLSSDVGVKGIIRKVGLFALLAIAHITDSVFGLGGVVRSTIILFLISNEALSVLENLSKMGIIIPKKLQDVLAQIKKTNE